MTKDSILNDLRYSTNLLPKTIIEDGENMKSLVLILQDIMDTHREDLIHEELFQQNFINTINYIYLEVFRNKVEKRDKKIFSQSFLDNVFSLPAHA